MRISSQQRDRLQVSRGEAFQRRCVEVIARRFPQPVEINGRAALEAAVDAGLAAGRGFGMRRGQHLLHFVLLRLWLGHRFWEDPGLPLAAPQLPGVPATEIGAHLRRVEAEAEAFLTRADGEGWRWRREALRRFRDASDEEVLPAPAPAESAGDYAVARLRWWHPRRCEALGAARLVQLVQVAEADMRARGDADTRMTALYAALCLLLGRGVLTDPWHGWVSCAVAEALALPGARGTGQLAAALRAHLAREP